jgi:hypothetical protein
MISQSVGLYFEAVDTEPMLIVRTKASAVVRVIRATRVPYRGIGVRSHSPNSLVYPEVHREVLVLKSSGFQGRDFFCGYITLWALFGRYPLRIWSLWD